MRIRSLALCLATAMSLVFPVSGAGVPPADSGSRFAEYCADAIVDSLHGRTWLVTDGFSDELLVARAKAKGIDLVVMPLRLGNSSVVQGFEAAVKHLGSSKLEAAAALGTSPFVLTWLAESPQVAQTNLALLVEPSLAKIAGFTPVPCGLVYGVYKPAEVTEALLKVSLAQYVEVRDSLGEAIVTASDDATTIAFMKRIRAQAAMCGNNLGVLLYQAKMKELALNVFSQAHAIDKANTSSLLNKASVVREGLKPELGEKIAEELNGLARSGGASWMLASTSGYVIKPTDFLEAKWYWVFSGIAASDGEFLKQSLAEVKDEKLREGIAKQLGTSFAMQTGGAQLPMMALAEFPKEGFTWPYMLKLADLARVMGDKPRALMLADRAAKVPGADDVAVAFAKSSILSKMGKTEEAVALLKAVKRDDNALVVLSGVASIYVNAGDTAKFGETLQAMVPLTNAPAWLATVSKSVQAQLAGKIAQAKQDSDAAIEAGADADYVFRSALVLDLMATDRVSAEKHADAALKINPVDSFANYVKAMMMTERKKYQEAEHFYQISISQNPVWFVLNDYASMVAETGRFEMSEMLARNALSSGGEKFAAVWDTLGVSLDGQKRYEEAIDAFKSSVVREGGDDPRIQLHYAEACLANGDPATAKTAISAIDKRVEELSISERERLGKLRTALGIEKK